MAHWHNFVITIMLVVMVFWTTIRDWNPNTVIIYKNPYTQLGFLVEHVQRSDSGFFRFLDLRFGQLDSAHGNHSTDCKMGCNAANPKPERPVQAVFQYDQHKEVLAIIGHPFRQTVVPYGCQETQQGQATKKSLEDRRRKGKSQMGGHEHMAIWGWWKKPLMFRKAA